MSEKKKLKKLTPTGTFEEITKIIQKELETEGTDLVKLEGVGQKKWIVYFWVDA